MRLRAALGVAAGTLGAAAVANRLLRSTDDETFERYLRGTPGTYRWRGFDVDYVEAGDPEDETVVLLHGISAAASNHEFGPIFDRLAETHHVIAPDLPGYGHSDRPPLSYSAALLTQFVTDFLADRPSEPIVVASSLTGAYAALAAREVPVRELVLVCPTDDTMGDRNVWRRSLLRSPLVGEALFNALVSERSLEHFQADHGYADPDRYTDDVRAYEWETSHRPGARFAPASFVSGFLDPEEDLEAALADLDVPVTLVWGREAETTPLSRGRVLAEAADARLVVFEDAKLLPHVEHPERFVELLAGDAAAIPVEERREEEE